MLEYIQSPQAPKPLGNYSHAVVYGEFIFLCGMGPRDLATNEVPGLVLDANGERQSYDIVAETTATIENMKSVLHDAGSSLDNVIEVNVFLTDMGDFEAMNKVYAKYFTGKSPVRTTLGVQSLPGKISVEMKAIAVRPK